MSDKKQDDNFANELLCELNKVAHEYMRLNHRNRDFSTWKGIYNIEDNSYTYNVTNMTGSYEIVVRCEKI